MMKSLWAAAMIVGAATTANAQGTAPMIEVLKHVSCGYGGWVAQM